MTSVALSPAVVRVTTAGRSATGRLGRLALDVVVATAVVLFLALAIGPRLLPYRTVTMLSGSMRPSAPVGSLLVDVAEPTSALKPGQVISFHAPVPGHPVVSHRVIEVQHRDGHVLIRTKGDANSAADPWLAEVHGNTVWRMRAALPGVGTAVRALRTPSRRWLMLYGVPGVLLVWLLVAVWRRPASAAEGGDSSWAYPDEPGPASPSLRPSVSASASVPSRHRPPSRRRRRRHSPSRPRSSSHRRR
jgi:signal peptidase